VTMRDEERIRRVARALQAAFAAISCEVPSGHFDFEMYYAEQELTFAAVMADSALGLRDPRYDKHWDPTRRGGWSWWAKRILDAADGENTE
jgi:hypothetical protein